MTVQYTGQAADLVNVPEAAEMTRLSEATIRWLVHTGKFVPGAKLGRRLFFRRADVTQWVTDRFAEAEQKRAS